MDFNGVHGGYLKFLSEKQVQKIHNASLEILEKTGVIIDSEELQDIFSERGSTVEREHNIVKLSPEVVEEAIEESPKEFTLYGREEGRELKVNDQTVHTHTTGGPPNIYDLETGRRRSALRKDVEDSAKLVDTLDHIHSYTPLVSPTDVDSSAIEIEMVDAAVRNTTKVISNPVMSEDEVVYTYKIFQVLAGGEEKLQEKPMFEVSPSPISPLTLDKRISGALVAAAERNIPTTILPCPYTGGSAPITFAGALAQQNAELLAGLTILQVVNPGNPTILGPRLSLMDPRNSHNTWGNTELGMVSACATQIIHSYELPSDVYGLCSDSKIMDQQLGYERGMNAIVPALAGSNFLSGAGGLESGKNSSLGQLVIDDEIFGMILKQLKTFEVNEETLAVDLINEVGPKGDFLRQKHSVKYARKGEQYLPEISNRSSWEEWVNEGKRSVVDIAEEKAESILSDHEPVPVENSVEDELDELLDEARDYYKSKA